MPSLRLKGDYLAIVTLGFGEIIRVVLQNIDAVGGPRGLIGIPAYTNLFWTYRPGGGRRVRGVDHGQFHLWPRLHRRGR